jgi:hypothetical protein
MFSKIINNSWGKHKDKIITVHVVSLYVIEISLDLYINFNFDFLDLHNVFFENYFSNELTRSFVYEAI